MTTALSAVSALANAASSSGVSSATGATDATASTDGSAFSTSLGNAVDSLSSLQNNASSLAIKAVSGDLTDVSQATIAATRAQVTMELVSAVRNKGVDAFNSIMEMSA